MSHNIELRDGKASFAHVGAPAWWGVGEQLPAGATVMDAFLASRANFPVKSVPIVAQPHPEYSIKAPAFRAIVREDQAHVLGVVTPSYKPVQNSELAALAEVFQADGRVTIETIGVLGKGERVFMLAKWRSPLANKEEIYPYLLLSNSHDGRHSLECMRTTIRVVCQNTLNAALAGNREFKFVHVGDMQDKLKQVAAALSSTEQAIGRFEEFVRYFQSKEVSSQQAEEFWAQLVPGDSGRSAGIREKLAAAYEAAPGHTTGAWGLLNAVSYYTDHEMSTRGKDVQSRLSNRVNSVFYGSGAKLKAQAVTLVKELVK